MAEQLAYLAQRKLLLLQTLPPLADTSLRTSVLGPLRTQVPSKLSCHNTLLLCGTSPQSFSLFSALYRSAQQDFNLTVWGALCTDYEPQLALSAPLNALAPLAACASTLLSHTPQWPTLLLQHTLSQRLRLRHSSASRSTLRSGSQAPASSHTPEA